MRKGVAVDHIIDPALAAKLRQSPTPPLRNRPLPAGAEAVSVLHVSACGCVMSEVRDDRMTVDQQVWSLLRRFGFDPTRFHGWKLTPAGKNVTAVQMNAGGAHG